MKLAGMPCWCEWARPESRDSQCPILSRLDLLDVFVMRASPGRSYQVLKQETNEAIAIASMAPALGPSHAGLRHSRCIYSTRWRLS
jgi:hypothetical protein